MKKPAQQKVEQSGLLWLIFLGGPVLWLIQFQTQYTLLEWACTHQKIAVLRSIGVLFISLPLILLILAYCLWRRSLRVGIREHDLRRFMFELGMFTSALFLLLILLQTMATFLIDPCAH